MLQGPNEIDDEDRGFPTYPDQNPYSSECVCDRAEISVVFIRRNGIGSGSSLKCCKSTFEREEEKTD